MRKHAHTAGSILLGSVLAAIGIQLFLAPNQLVIGGASGIAIIINHLTGLPMGVLMVLINAPIFLIALRNLGWVFLLTAFAGVIITSTLVDVLAFWELVPTQNLLLAAVYAGLSIGAGVALLFRAGSSSGGMDLLARLILLKRPHLTLGWALLFIDLCIIIGGVLVFRQVEMALYAGISVFVLKRTVDAVLRKDNAKTTTSQ